MDDFDRHLMVMIVLCLKWNIACIIYCEILLRYLTILVWFGLVWFICSSSQPLM